MSCTHETAAWQNVVFLALGGCLFCEHLGGRTPNPGMFDPQKHAGGDPQGTLPEFLGGRPHCADAPLPPPRVSLSRPFPAVPGGTVTTTHAANTATHVASVSLRRSCGAGRSELRVAGRRTVVEEKRDQHGVFRRETWVEVTSTDDSIVPDCIAIHWDGMGRCASSFGTQARSVSQAACRTTDDSL